MRLKPKVYHKFGVFIVGSAEPIVVRQSTSYKDAENAAKDDVRQLQSLNPRTKYEILEG